MKKRLFPVVLLIFFSILAHGCGSGGGGGSNGSSNSSTLTNNSSSGVVQKGPFVSGSEVLFWDLDDNLNRTGINYSVKTDDAGVYSIPNLIQSKFVEVVATGLYFNEVSGQLSKSAISLTSVCDLSTNVTPNINILTSLTNKRIKYLVKNNGLSFAEARHQAEAEILIIFGILKPATMYFDEMDLSMNGRNNAILLLLSSILQGDNTEAQLSGLIDDISNDLIKDGKIDSLSTINELNSNLEILDLTSIINNLSNYYKSLELSEDIPSISDFSNIYDQFELQGFAEFYGPGSSCMGGYSNHNAGKYSYNSTSNALTIDGKTITVIELSATTMVWNDFPGYIKYFDSYEPIWSRVSAEGRGIIGKWRIERDHFTVELTFHELGSYGFYQNNDPYYGCFSVTSTENFVDLYGPGSSCMGGYSNSYAGTYIYDSISNSISIDGLPATITELNSSTMIWSQFPEGINDESPAVWTKISGEDTGVIAKWSLERDYFTVELTFHELGSYGFYQNNDPLYGCYK